MAYSEELAERVRPLIGAREQVTERKMFGGIAWMVNGNMACGVSGDGLLVRLDPSEADRVLAEPHVGLMEMGGRTMRGFFRVDAAGLGTEPELAGWVDAGGSYAASLEPK